MGSFLTKLRSTVAYAAAFLVVSGLFPSPPAYAATIALNGASALWTPVLVGPKFDPGNDTQATSSIDLVGNAAYPLMSMWFDDKGDGDTANDELALRWRVDTARKNGNLDGYLWIGIDVDRDGDLDTFLVLEGKSGTNKLYVYQAGAGANNSPSTSSITGGVLLKTFTGTDFSHALVGTIDGEAADDVDADGSPDDFVSFKFNFQSFATAANAMPLTGGGGNISTINTGAGLTKDTIMRFVGASAQQTNALNGDMGGYNATDSASVTFSAQGAFSPIFPLGAPEQAAEAPSPVDQTGFSLALPASITYGSTGTASTSGGSGTGAVTYSAGASTGCTVDASSGLITVTNAGGTCSITATKAGDSSYNTATDGPRAVTLNKATATINVTGYSVAYDGVPHTATGTATGVLGENLSGLLNLSGTTHTSAGTYTNDPWSFAGNSNYSSASGTVSSTIAGAAQSGFNLTAPASITYGSTGTASVSGGSGTGAVTYSAGGSTGCTVDINSGVITVTNASGTCSITATKAGDTNYSAATAGPRSVTLNKATATVNVTGYSVAYDGVPHTATGTATGVLGENLSGLLNLTSTTHTSAGTYTNDPWSFAGNSNYSSAGGTVSSSIAVAAQTGFDLTAPSSITYGSTGTASVSGGSGTGAVTYSAGASTGCTVDINSGVITVTNASGTCAITATKAGDTNHSAATAGPRSVTLNKATATINVTGYSATYDGTPRTATGTATGVSGEDLSSLLDLSGTTHTSVGTYADDPWSFAGDSNYSSTGGTVSSLVTAASQSGFGLTVPVSITYGSTGTVSTGGGSGTGAVTYSAGDSTGCTVDAATGVITVTNAGGTCAISATKAADADYSAVTDGPKAVTLNKASAVISVTGYSVTFDGAAHTATGTAAGVTGEDLSSLLDLSGTTHTSAGTYSNDPWTFAGNGNYSSASGTVASNIAAPPPPPPPPAPVPVVTRPVIGSVGAQKNTEGDTVTVSVSGSGQNGERITFSAAGLPPGLAINPETGAITGKVSDKAAGEYQVTVTVTDPSGDQASTGFTWTVVKATGKLTGRVLTAVGTPVSGMGVIALDAGGNTVSQTTSDSQGAFSFDKLPAGDFTLVTPSLEKELTRGQTTVVAGQTAALNLVIPGKAALSLTASPAALVGDGVSRSTLYAALKLTDGTPVAGVQAQFIATGGTLTANSASTDANGVAAVTLTAPRIEGVTPRHEQVKVVVNDKERGIFAEATIVVTFLPASIQGVVADGSTGKPVAGAQVSVSEDFNRDGVVDFAAKTTSGPDGTYTVVVPRGDWAYNVEILVPVKVGGETVMLKQRHPSNVGQLTGVGQTITASRKVGGQLFVVGEAGQGPQETAKALTKGTAITGQFLTAAGAPSDHEVKINADGTFEVEDVRQGQYTMLFQVTAPSGEKLAGVRMNVTVDKDGELAVQTGLIDPYGTVTDSATGKPVAGVTMKLFWADTALNRSKGRQPDTLVSLPVLPDFAPNQNRVPQITTVEGAYAWMVWPQGDYYIMADKPGYVTYDSRVEKRTVAVAPGEDSWITAGIIHVGESIVRYDMAMKQANAGTGTSGPSENAGGGTGQPQTGAPLLPKPERPASGSHERYILGYPDGTFRPDRSINRAEVATIMVRILHLPVVTPATLPFTDVPADKWYAANVAAAVKAGIMTGYPDGTFRPEAAITRAEVATVADRLRGLKPLAGSAFADTAGHWSEGYLVAAKQEGLMKGYQNGTFLPEQLMSRAEFVTTVNRLLNRGPLNGRPTPKWPDVPDSYWAAGDVAEASTNHKFEAAAGPSERWLGDE